MIGGTTFEDLLTCGVCKSIPKVDAQLVVVKCCNRVICKGEVKNTCCYCGDDIVEKENNAFAAKTVEYFVKTENEISALKVSNAQLERENRAMRESDHVQKRKQKELEDLRHELEATRRSLLNAQQDLDSYMTHSEQRMQNECVKKLSLMEHELKDVKANLLRQETDNASLLSRNENLINEMGIIDENLSRQEITATGISQERDQLKIEVLELKAKLRQLEARPGLVQNEPPADARVESDVENLAKQLCDGLVELQKKVPVGQRWRPHVPLFNLRTFPSACDNQANHLTDRARGAQYPDTDNLWSCRGAPFDATNNFNHRNAQYGARRYNGGIIGNENSIPEGELYRGV